MMFRRLFIFLFALTWVLNLSAQEVEWSVDANVVVNNREGEIESHRKSGCRSIAHGTASWVA